MIPLLKADDWQKADFENMEIIPGHILILKLVAA